MNAITVTRDYGAGGYEVARSLAERLGWELLDRELLHRAAALEHVPDAELERLDEKPAGLLDRFRLHPPHQKYLHGLGAVARQAAARGNVVLVGRGTGQLLAETPGVLHLRLVAALDWRARRLAEREAWPLPQAQERCAQEDRQRERFTRYFFGDAPFHTAAYHAICNTERVPLEDVVACVVALVRGTSEPALPALRPRVLTLARELGADEASFVASLARRLGLAVHDKGSLDQEAARRGRSPAEIEQMDEQRATVHERFRPGSPDHRYFEALGQVLGELARRGDVLLVGRGGNRFLRDHPGAFHVRLVSTPDGRVRQVMRQRWLQEGLARQILADSDGKRRRFHEGYFGADWADPLEYHLTVNSGRLGPGAVDLAALAAGRHWGRA